MGNVFFKSQGMGQGDSGTVLDYASRFVESHSAKEANSNGGDEVSAFATSGPTTSARIASMLASKSEFETELEYRTACSKVHWSELSHPETPAVDHRQYFEKLQKDAQWGGFCRRVTNVVLGRKLGEGAQADIYKAQVTFAGDKWSLFKKRRAFVVKLMKGDCALEDLQHQWPCGIAESSSFYSSIILSFHGALVKEPATEMSKFGFVMERFWGDLRSLIDLRMEHKNARGPPFSLRLARRLMGVIAFDMFHLHERGIIHRDLKSSNILVSHFKKRYDIVSSNRRDLILPVVADWECSLGVVGTGWWRAPELLLQLKNGTPSLELEFNEKVDVYSFAMTCYEIATGVTPFEGCPYSSELRDAILDGARPELPHDLDPDIKAMITSCWDLNPSLRPSFYEVSAIL